MSTTNENAAASAAATETSAPAAPAVASTSQQTTPAPVGLTSEQLKARLDETRATTEKNLLKSLGFDKVEDVKAFVKVAKELQAAKLSDQEKLESAVKELTPKAERAAALEARLAAVVETQFSALPENVRKAIDSTANGDAEKRLELMSMLQASGLLTQAPGVAPPAAPATVAPPAAPSPPKTNRSKFDEYHDLVKQGLNTQAALFYQANAQAIEKARPA